MFRFDYPYIYILRYLVNWYKRKREYDFNICFHRSVFNLWYFKMRWNKAVYFRAVRYIFCNIMHVSLHFESKDVFIRVPFETQHVNVKEYHKNIFRKMRLFPDIFYATFPCRFRSLIILHRVFYEILTMMDWREIYGRYISRLYPDNNLCQSIDAPTF